MSFDDGTWMNESGGLRLKRLANAIPASYTVFTIDGDTYAETNIAGGTNYDTTGGDSVATVIQNAIDALTNGAVFLRAGTHTIDATLTLDDDVLLIGEGFGSILYEANSANLTRMVFINGKSRSGIINMALDGNQSNNATATQIIDINNSDIVWLDGLLLKNARNNAVYTSGNATRWQYTNLWIDTVNDYQGLSFNGADYGFIDNVHIKDCASYGVDLSDVTYSSMSNVYMEGTGSALKIDDGNAVTDICKNLTIDNVVMRSLGATLDAVTIDYTQDSVLNNITFDGGNNGVRISNSDAVTLSNIRGYNPAAVGCYIVDTSSNVTLANSHFDTVGTVGIGVNGTDCIVHGNTLTNVTSYDIQALASSVNCTIKNNLFSNASGALRDQSGGGNVYDIVARTATSADLSGGAETLVVLHAENPLYLINAYLLYTEASSADAGITWKLGKETDDDYYDTNTTETNKAQWYTKTVYVEQDIAAGDTVLFNSAGGKAGAGEIMCICDVATCT